MTPNQLPPLPEPDTHCFDDDTGKDVWSYTADQMHAYALSAIAKQAQPVHQFRRRLCADWYDGHPDHEDGGGPYETRILYTAPPAPQPTRHLTVTTTESGEAVMVSWQDNDHRILEVVWERKESAKQPDVPVVSDEQILEAAREWSNSNFVAGSERFLLDFARAILALRPAVEPMTPEQINEMALQEEFLLVCDGVEELTEIVRAVEAHHFGITAKAEGVRDGRSA